MWGLNAVNYAFGVNSYYNPYYSGMTESCPVAYDQPIVGDPSYATATQTDADTQSAQTTDTTMVAASQPDPLTETFDSARQAFYTENYTEALNLTNQALKQAPMDAAMNEFRSLCLFALGQYRDAAATIHAVLAAGPGWDWTTLISLYSNPETYTAQFRKLEAEVKANPKAADTRFLLGYHYLTGTHQEAAEKMWKAVCELQPNDQLAKNLAQMYAASDTEGPAPADSSSSSTSSDFDKPAIPPEKLRGKWTAKSSDGEFALTFDKDDQFTWTFTRDGKPQSVAGVYAERANNLVMQPDSGGTMLASVALKDDQTLEFDPVGDAKKLTFKK